MSTNKPNYELEGRELIAQASGLRVQILTLGPGQCVPWHRHTTITDTFICLEGPVVITTREPEGEITLMPGERAAVPPGQPHLVTPAAGSRCRFVIVQGVGEYDYLPEEESTNQA